MAQKSTRLNTTAGDVDAPRRMLKAAAVIVVVIVCIAVVQPPASEADEPSDFGRICSDQAAHRVFIVESFKHVEDDADRERVLDTLVCIVTRENSDPLVACGALRAIFHISEDNQRIQEYLLRVIRDERTKDATVWTACKLFVYVSDKDGQKELLEHAKRQWDKRRANHALQALVELGDMDALQWLDRTADGLIGDDPLRSVLDAPRKRIRIQHDVASLLAYLKSEREDLDRGWVVRQAMRHGASRENIRKAAVAYLRRVDQETPPFLHLSLVRACDEYGIFSPRDARDIERIRIAREIQFSAEDEGRWPRWATLPDTKRAEFYSLNR